MLELLGVFFSGVALGGVVGCLLMGGFAWDKGYVAGRIDERSHVDDGLSPYRQIEGAR